ncbi:MAG: hypothetical protein NVSMB32_00170 [Actinomycetota bacterium]
MSGSALTHAITTSGIVLVAVLGAWAVFQIASLVICLLKGKWGMFAGGLLLAGLLANIGAIRLAKPTSFWARRFYGEVKCERARQRFHPEQQLPTWGLEPQDGLPPSSAEWHCTLCGRYFLDQATALGHADSVHTEFGFAEAKAAIRAVSTSTRADPA